MTYIPRTALTLNTIEDIRLYLDEELRRVSLAIQEIDVAQFQVLHVEPTRLPDGLVAYADGVNWNPGSGKGLYERRNGAWVRAGLATAAEINYTQAGAGAVTRTVQSRLREVVYATDFGLVPNTGTDQSTALANAIASLPALGGIVILPTGTVKFASSINLAQKAGVILRGQGKSTTILVYTGTGARFVDARSSIFTWVEDLLLTSDNLSFTGILADFSNSVGESAYGGARRVAFGSQQAIVTTGNITSGSAVVTNIPSTTGMVAGMRIMGTGIPYPNSIISVDSATQITMSRNATATTVGVTLTIEGGKIDIGIYLDQSTIMTVDDCYFALIREGVRGLNTGGTGYSNVVIVNNSTFIDCVLPMGGVGSGWQITNNTFEQAVDGTGTAILNNSVQRCLGVLIAANWFGDSQKTGGTLITLVGDLTVSNLGGGIAITGNTMGASVGTTGVKLINIEGAVISGNLFTFLATGVDFATGASRNIVVEGNRWHNVTTRYANTGNIGEECWLEGFATSETRFSSHLDLASGKSLKWNGGSILINHNAGADQMAFLGASGGYIFDGEVTPDTDAAYDLGRSNLAWRDLYLGDSPAVGSIGEFKANWRQGTTVRDATVTITIASPAVITWTDHPFFNNTTSVTAVTFTTTGSLPTGIVAGTVYYATAVDANTFKISTTIANAIAGTYVNTSGSQSGTHTANIRTSLTTTTPIDIAGLSLTTGDWDIEGFIYYIGSGSTVVDNTYLAVSTASGTGQTFEEGRYASDQFPGSYTPGANVFKLVTTPTARFQLGSTTTIFLTFTAQFSASTMIAYGGLRARRVR